MSIKYLDISFIEEFQKGVGQLPKQLINPRKKKSSNKRDMTTKNIPKLNRGIRNLPQKNLGAVVKVIKKRGILYKQNKEKLQLDNRQY